MTQAAFNFAPAGKRAGRTAPPQLAAVAGKAVDGAARPPESDNPGDAIGFEHARYGLVPPAPCLWPGHPVREGWERGRRLIGRRTRPATLAVTRWLSLRLGAWLQGEAFDDHQITPQLLRSLEVAVSDESREREDDLLIVDGPLRERRHLPRALGYVKTHQKTYLPPELTAVVVGLRGGQRSPVFVLGTSWHRYSWYVRLPGPAGSPWAGIVRVECAADLTPEAAIGLAHLSAATLPRFASTPYKDPRAPQNLIPIAGLERRLRMQLGDARLLHRALLNASRRAALSGTP